MAKVSKREWTAPNGEQKSAWQVHWLYNGKQSRKQFAKKKDADAYRIKIEGDIQKHIHIAPRESMPIAALAELWIRAEETRYADGRISLGHLRNVKMIVEVSIKPFIGKVVASEFKPFQIEDWYNRLVKVGKLKPSTAKYRIQFCGAMFAYAVRREWIAANPVKDGAEYLRGIKREAVRQFTHEEVKSILMAVEVKRYKSRRRTLPMARCFIHLALFCGMRYGEIAGLKLDNCDLQKGIIRVRHSLTDTDVLKCPKTKAGVRDVPMPAHVVDILREWVEFNYVANDRRLLFRIDECRSDGKFTGFIFPSNFRYAYWKPVLKEAGVYTSGKVPHFHALRHFASSWMIANQMPLPDVAEIMGHAEFDTTLRIYAHSVMTRSHRSSAIESAATRLLAGPSLISFGAPAGA